MNLYYKVIGGSLKEKKRFKFKPIPKSPRSLPPIVDPATQTELSIMESKITSIFGKFGNELKKRKAFFTDDPNNGAFIDYSSSKIKMFERSINSNEFKQVFRIPYQYMTTIYFAKEYDEIKQCYTLKNFQLQLRLTDELPAKLNKLDAQIKAQLPAIKTAITPLTNILFDRTFDIVEMFAKDYQERRYDRGQYFESIFNQWATQINLPNHLSYNKINVDFLTRELDSYLYLTDISSVLNQELGQYDWLGFYNGDVSLTTGDPRLKDENILDIFIHDNNFAIGSAGYKKSKNDYRSGLVRKCSLNILKTVVIRQEKEKLKAQGYDPDAIKIEVWESQFFARVLVEKSSFKRLPDADINPTTKQLDQLFSKIFKTNP